MSPRLDALAAASSAIVHGEALDVLRRLPDGCAGLVYVDPPFNTGERRTAVRTRTTADGNGGRAGFAGKRYREERSPGDEFADRFDDYAGWLRPRLLETRRILARHGSLFFHILSR